ncbi:MAG: shikimate dehydrogenase [Lachnospiraceae bacterium]|nr:shikimate dehydrogenase [Lachnospiraceae bacterium]
MITIDGQTKICGLLGYPVKHTLSPMIHEILAHHTGENLAYIPCETDPSHLADAVKGAQAMHFLGLNVTVPHKSAIIPFLSSIDPLAGKVGAVNTLVPEEDGFRGYNTDLTGLGRAMRYDGVSIPKEKTVLIGAGGAARAAAFLLAENGVTEAYIINRTLESATKLCDNINTTYGRTVFKPLLLSQYDRLPGDGYLAVQATSVGLFPDNEKAPIMDEAFYQKCSVGYDLIYRPFETRFMRFFREQGKPSFNGLRMLIFQGIEAYEKWTGKPVSDDVVPEVIEALERHA